MILWLLSAPCRGLPHYGPARYLLRGVILRLSDKDSRRTSTATQATGECACKLLGAPPPFFQGRLFRLFCHPDRSGRLFPPLAFRAPAAEWRDRGIRFSHTHVDETNLTNNGLPCFCHPDRSGRLFPPLGSRAPAAEWRDRGAQVSHTQVDETNLTNNGLPFFCHPDRSGRLFPPLGSRAPAAEWRDRGAQFNHTQVDETKPPSIEGILSSRSCSARLPRRAPLP